ncbi:glycosyltransferase [Chryseolinea lacunae]|uniref:Glycosyltransferase n=1 Tax=Chryseolinea lacunae TaxID=2801331 RepID=A0ABS1KX29_9BACT|nr:glycosyltransferase [Chryseolinea lacunae]MBL0744033.1 glycosyltransferase [Chryseolinea lacunae]
MTKSIAIVSPNKDAYSETFIQAHRKLLSGKVFYYYGGGFPSFYDDTALGTKVFFKGVLHRVLRSCFYRQFSSKEFLLAKSFRTNKIKVVLAEYGPTAVAVLKVVRVLGIPMVVHFHGYDATHKPTLERNSNGYKEVFKYATAIIAVSRAMEKQLIALGAPAEKIVYNPYGVDNSFLTLSPTFVTKQFLSVGRFVDKKAPYLTLISFKHVLEKHPDAKLVMVGDGVLWEVCKELINAFEMGNNVNLIGPLGRDEIQDLMVNSIAFVQHSITPSHGDSEGTPVAILEAQALGLPVIATRHAGIIDVVEEGVTGLLCDERDVKSMSQHLLFILENRELARKMGVAGKEKIHRHFTMERHIRLLNEGIEIILNRPR